MGERTQSLNALAFVVLAVLAMVAKRKTGELQGIGGLSDSGLVSILQKLRSDRTLLTEGPTHRLQLYRHKQNLYNEFGHQITMPLEKGGAFQWEVARADKLLRFFCKESEEYAALMERTLRQLSPGEPLGLLLYNDEVTPGNVLAPDNKRKFNNFYFAFVQFGAAALQNERNWLPVAVLRASCEKTIAGGLSATFAAILRMLCYDSDLIGGMTLSFATENTYTFRCVVWKSLWDESGLKRCLDTKGAAGIQFCLKCNNCVSYKSGIAGGSLVSSSCSDIKQFVRRTDEELWMASDALVEKRGVLSKTAFEKEQTLYGLNDSANGVLQDKALRQHFLPVSRSNYESMHVFFSNGVCNVELRLMLKTLEGHGIDWADVAAFAKSGLKWPRYVNSKGQQIHDCFSEKRRKSSKKLLKAGASETMMCMHVVRHFLDTVILSDARTADVAKHEVASFALLTDVVSLLDRAKHAADPRAFVAPLAEKIGQWHAAFQRAYPLRWMRR
jgi:hypothetical protein